MKTSCGKFLNLAHYFPYDVKLRLLAHSRSYLAKQKARNAIVGAENLLINGYYTQHSKLQLARNGSCVQEFFSSDINRVKFLL